MERLPCYVGSEVALCPWAFGLDILPRDIHAQLCKEDLGFPLTQAALFPSALPSRVKEEKLPWSSHPPPGAAHCWEGAILMDPDTWLCPCVKGGQHRTAFSALFPKSDRSSGPRDARAPGNSRVSCGASLLPCSSGLPLARW